MDQLSKERETQRAEQKQGTPDESSLQLHPAVLRTQTNYTPTEFKRLILCQTKLRNIVEAALGTQGTCG